jgi:hypothetical protein
MEIRIPLNFASKCIYSEYKLEILLRRGSTYKPIVLEQYKEREYDEMDK